MRNRVLKGGYFDLGPIQIPPVPSYVVLTDQDDGNQYVLTFDTHTNTFETTSDLSIIAKDAPDFYDKDSGPIFSDAPGYRLVTSFGELFAKFDPCYPQTEVDRSSAPIYARNRTSALAMTIDDVNILEEEPDGCTS